MARPLVPQPILPNVQPITPVAAQHLQPVRNNYALKSTRSRRGTINAACHECRLKKLKCDGIRPRCRRCIEKGLDTCEYTVNPGETRFTALKRKNAVLVSDADRMRNFIDALRSASPSQTHLLLNHLRTSESTPHGPPSLASPRQLQPSLVHQSSDSSNSSVPSHPSSRTRVTQASLDSPISSLDSSASPEQDLWSSESPLSPFANLEVRLPDETVLQECVNAFFTESGPLFHVFTREHTDEQFQLLLGQANEQSRRIAACELCAVGSIGSQYMKDVVPKCTEQAMYSAAKHFFEDVVSLDVLRASKVCVMLSMFNVMSKEKVALTFVDTGLNILQRSKVFSSKIYQNELERTRSVAARKTWRALVFLEGWLSSTLGYISGLPLVSTAMDMTKFEIEGETEFEDKVVTEMMKIAVIKFNMLRLSLSFDRFSALSVETISKELQQWYQNLPADMHVLELNGHTKPPTELRRTIYYVNLLYYGAHIMLFRRVLHSMTDRDNLLSNANLAIDELAAQANHAARKSAELFKRFRAGGGIVKKCWICIFQSYSSCVLLLHEVAQGLLRRTNHLDQDLDLAAVCLDFLEYCSSADVAARQFLDTLMPLYNTLRAVTVGQFQSALGIAAATLRELVAKPLQTPGSNYSQTLKQRTTQQLNRQGRDEQRLVGVNDLCNETLSEELALLKSDDWQIIDGIKNDGSINDLVNATLSGSFVPGFESHTWNGE